MGLVRQRTVAAALAAALAMSPLGVTPALAHCDGLDGPVVAAARKALAAGDVKPILIWVQAADEAEIAAAFDRALAVRRLGRQAQELADLYFFETLVRVHRAGEGAPYTGLKPTGRDLGPAIPAADRAIETADLKPVSALLEQELNAGLAERFHQLIEAKRHAGDSVEAGRRYVASYVRFIHYVERLHEAAVSPAHGHSGEPAAEAGHAR